MKALQSKGLQPNRIFIMFIKAIILVSGIGFLTSCTVEQESIGGFTSDKLSGKWMVETPNTVIVTEYTGTDNPTPFKRVTTTFDHKNKTYTVSKETQGAMSLEAGFEFTDKVNGESNTYYLKSFDDLSMSFFDGKNNFMLNKVSYAHTTPVPVDYAEIGEL
ncbi:MAG: hypothetical protein ACJAS1_000814 [Oleiphilaceae bacterium]